MPAYRWRTSESNDFIPYTHHGYAYALSDPVLYTDPHGTSPQKPSLGEGIYVHAVIQEDFLSKNPGGAIEFIVPGASKNNPGKYIGFVDMALPSTGEFYEIKHRYGQGKAADEVLHYMAYLNKPGSRTSATGEWVPGDTYLGDGETYQFGLWPIGLSQNYNPTVDGYYRIMAQLDEPGVIHYWAEPLGKDEKARNYNYNPAHVEQFIDLKYPGLRRRSYPGGAQPLPEEPDDSVLGQAGAGAVVAVCIIKVAEIIAGAVLGGPAGAGAGALAPVP